MGTEQTGSYWHVDGGLHSAEIRIIQRALRMYMEEYHKLKATPTYDKPHEKQEMQDAIDAAVRLSNRLRKELIPVGDKPESGGLTDKQKEDQALKRRLTKHAKQYFNT